MLLFYDWRLALISMIFPPVSYVIAEKMKVIVQRTGAAYKEQSGALSSATLDRAANAVTYRVFGCEPERVAAYEENLSVYERSAVRANIWSASLPPIYRIISMAALVFILYFGGRQCARPGLDGLGYRGLHYLYRLLYQACGEILQRGQAFQRGA